jgi:hypothetical protein
MSGVAVSALVRRLPSPSARLTGTRLLRPLFAGRSATNASIRNLDDYTFGVVAGLSE